LPRGNQKNGLLRKEVKRKNGNVLRKGGGRWEEKAPGKACTWAARNVLARK